MIPDSFKQDLLNRVDIVELIERYVPLRKGGSNYAACCPFHTEKSPSFTVSPTKQFYHCFGCGAHGNAISFLMEYQGLGYIDALKDLAESVGMKLPEQSREVRRDAPGPDLYEIMERAARYFREQLKASPQAIEYLKGRGLTGQVAARFGIGYAPPGWQNLQSVFTDYGGAALKEAGLVIDAEGGRRYDRFRDRIMFPILNQRGAVIGFGGRVLGQGEPKYLNSPETPLFEKGRELYGLSQARNAIRTEARAVVTEGYMDVVALAQHGIEFAVATLGTATSAVHVQKLFRMTGEVVFCFDGDAAGRRAAWHALEVALPVLADDKVVRFMFLPQEDDPDSFVRSKGAESFRAMVAQARPLSEFLLSELRSRVDSGTAEGRSRLVAESKPLLKKIAAPALQLQMLRELADAARMETGDVARLLEIRIATPGGRRNIPRSETPRRSSGDELIGRRLLRCVLANPQLALQVRGFAEQNDAPPYKALLAIADALEDAPQASAAWLIDRFGDADFAPLLVEARAQLLELRLEADELEAEFRGELMRLKTISLAHQIGALKDKASRQGLSSAESDEYNRLIKEHAALKQLPREQHNAL